MMMLGYHNLVIVQCPCKLCDHRVTADCIKSNCNCCTDSNHSMVMDGIEGIYITAIKMIKEVKL